VDQQYPPPGGIVSGRSVVTASARFSKSVNPNSVSGNIVALDENSGEYLSTDRVSFDFYSRTFSVVLTPAELESSIKVIVRGGSGGVRDLTGSAMVGDVEWTFHTSSAADSTPPQVGSVSPSSGSQDVSVQQLISIRFDEPMEEQSVLSSLAVYRSVAGAHEGNSEPFERVHTAWARRRKWAERPERKLAGERHCEYIYDRALGRHY